jgi:hypothetical protein
LTELRDQLCPSWCTLLPRHDGPHRPAGQNDSHRTGCGCASCGPARHDPFTFEDPETHQMRNERDQLQGRIARALDLLEGSDIPRTAAAAIRVALTGRAGGLAGHE